MVGVVFHLVIVLLLLLVDTQLCEMRLRMHTNFVTWLCDVVVKAAVKACFFFWKGRKSLWSGENTGRGRRKENKEIEGMWCLMYAKELVGCQTTIGMGFGE